MPSHLRVPVSAAGVEVLDRTTQLEEGLADLGPLGQAALLEGLDRPVEQPVGGLGRLADVGVAHGADVVGLGGELRARGLGRRQRAQVLVDLGVEDRDGLLGDGRSHLRGRGLLDGRGRRGRDQRQDLVRWLQGLHRRGGGGAVNWLGVVGGHAESSVCFPAGWPGPRDDPRGVRLAARGMPAEFSSPDWTLWDGGRRGVGAAGRGGGHGRVGRAARAHLRPPARHGPGGRGRPRPGAYVGPRDRLRQHAVHRRRRPCSTPYAPTWSRSACPTRATSSPRSSWCARESRCSSRSHWSSTSARPTR